MTNTDKKYIDAHKRFIKENGRYPTIREFAKYMSYSYSSAQKNMKKLRLEYTFVRAGLKKGQTKECERTLTREHCPACEEVRPDRYPYFMGGKLKMVCADCVEHYDKQKEVSAIEHSETWSIKNELVDSDPQPYFLKVGRQL